MGSNYPAYSYDLLEMFGGLPTALPNIQLRLQIVTNWLYRCARS